MTKAIFTFTLNTIDVTKRDLPQVASNICQLKVSCPIRIPQYFKKNILFPLHCIHFQYNCQRREKRKMREERKTG